VSQEVVWLASASRTTTQTSADIETASFNDLEVTVVTTVIGTGSITRNGTIQRSYCGE